MRAILPVPEWTSLLPRAAATDSTSPTVERVLINEGWSLERFESDRAVELPDGVYSEAMFNDDHVVVPDLPHVEAQIVDVLQRANVAA